MWHWSVTFAVPPFHLQNRCPPWTTAEDSTSRLNWKKRPIYVTRLIYGKGPIHIYTCAIACWGNEFSISICIYVHISHRFTTWSGHYALNQALRPTHTLDQAPGGEALPIHCSYQIILHPRQLCIQIIWSLQNKKLGTTNCCLSLNLRTTGFGKDLWNYGDSAISTSHSPLWDSRIFVWSRLGPLCAQFCVSARVAAAARMDYGVWP